MRDIMAMTLLPLQSGNAWFCCDARRGLDEDPNLLVIWDGEPGLGGRGIG